MSKLLFLFFVALTILTLPFISSSSTSAPSNQEVDAETWGCQDSFASTSSSSTTARSDQEEVDAVIKTLLCQGGFTIWAKLLDVSKTKLVLTVNATMFVPTDAAIMDLRYATEMNPSLIPYHVTPKHHLLLSDLYHLKPLTLLPTLVPWKTILITSTLLSNYKIDNAIITQTDIYVSSRLVVHGINHILDLNPQRSSMPPLLRSGNVLGASISPAPAPASA
ncbi:FAS1 domain-containing protein [Heracleum sosnowskyi]|uniref:FAS1 domain-containing protein n=1 Tax=Heracleum sosnowskyi TaxID=360622 RepID=A0AAD8HSW8_9APIA|nr:FAS1 domain-containing protein [Heracleum sosnowskyi]